ncbi:uncharacterized membrane protein (DUF485 family) [Azomonas agilis]|uniref:Uncharacterized membrane protein (DUF485 family) n=1 Tax=Azomonas agilis TaxID=116849 RepID=A0A562J195_9GAMM|nr:DUF485 domain-containing protein [Azomonas agilis]TWH76575.1 uncharacterized membrane protein (DUF485 family) [Azomonas agilis]
MQETNDDIQRIYEDPRFKELVAKKSGFANLLSVIILGAYFAFILLIAFDPKLLGIPVVEGSPITWGIPMGVGIILLSFLLTGVYTLRANGEFDNLTKEVLSEVQK